MSDDLRPYCDRCGDRDECECPDDLDGPIYCGHGKDVDTYCVECAVAGEMALAGAFAAMLDKLQEREDEAKGAALAARFDKLEIGS